MDVGKEALKIVRNIIKIGQVSSINAKDGTVKVLFPDKGDTISNDLPLLNFEYNMPKIGDQVLCIFLGNGLERGICIGGFYSNISKPPISDESIYRKEFEDKTYIEYNKATKTLSIVSENEITLKGDIKIDGNLNVTGNVTASNIGS